MKEGDITYHIEDNNKIHHFDTLQETQEFIDGGKLHIARFYVTEVGKKEEGDVSNIIFDVQIDN